MPKQDLTRFSDEELSLVVMNTDYLYFLIRSPDVLMSTIGDTYIYTDAQMTVLLEDLN